MSNNKQQTAVDSLKDFFKQYDLAHSSLDYYEFKIPMHIFDLKFQETKEMEKVKMIEFAQEVFRNRYNQITQSLGNIADDIYNETFGGNND